jgi:integrase
MPGTLAATMPRSASGAIETHRWEDGKTVIFRARVRAYGRQWRVPFGTNHEGWNEDRARVELDVILERIRRGTWKPPPDRRDERDDLDPHETVRVTAYRWWQRRKTELAPNTRLDYQWRLDHLMRHLAGEETVGVDARKVDDLRQALVGRGLSARSVNMILDLLAQVLDDAVEYKLLDANPARGRRRRVKVARSRRSFLEPDMVVDLLDEAGAWERSLPEHQRYGRRAFLAVLCIAGPRISELTSAPRARLDLHGGRLRVGEAKTEAGLRDLELTAFLLDELRAHLAAVPAAVRDRGGAALPIFPTRTGGRLNPSNVRNRLLNGTPPRSGRAPTQGVVQRVNERRSAEGRMLLPDRVTPHTLRRTFASVALAAGRDLRWVMGQLGHADARLTLNLYAQVMQRQRVDEALIWQLMRFPDEPEEKTPGARFETTIEPIRAPRAGGGPAADRPGRSGMGP